MTYAALAVALYDIGCVRVGDFLLASGKHSPVYIDLRQLVSYPDVLKAVSEVIWGKIKHLSVDRICGVPYTALPIATTISIMHDKPMIMVRKEIKEYGTKKLIEGVFEKGDSCVMIEDLVTTGGSVIKAAKQLQAEGLHVTDVAVLLDREQGGDKCVRDAGFTLHAGLKITELFSYLTKANKLTSEEQEKINTYLAELP